MTQLKVIVRKLNKRSSIPNDFSEKNIISTVQQGLLFEGEEVTTVPNASLGKWYKGKDGGFYWGGGLIDLGTPLGLAINIKDLPSNLPALYRAGIDISHHNILQDWNAITNAGVSFVYIKISEGVGTPDNKAKDHALIAKQNGMRIGYYHFCRPDTKNGSSVTNDATAEADDAISRIKLSAKPDLPLVLDLEDQAHWDSPLNKPDYLLWVNTFINKIKENDGTDVMIYSRKEYLDRKLPADHNLGKYRLWISRYKFNDGSRVACPVGWSDWAIWQYTEDGAIGNNAKLDINILKDQTLF